MPDESPQRLILMVGLPYSGKTTWARKQGYPIVQPDAIRIAFHGKRFESMLEPWVWLIAKIMVRALFRAGHQEVIVDACNISMKRRMEWYRLGTGYVVEEKVMAATPDECVARAADAADQAIYEVIRRMATEADHPHLPWAVPHHDDPIWMEGRG